jgi:LAGLIDADG DNA endonuclease family protein
MTYEYIAGLFDGEGCINLMYSKGSVSVKVSISQKNRSLLELVKEFTQKGGIRSMTNKSCCEWSMTKREDVKTFLTAVVPHLILRKTEAEIAIQLCDAGGRQGIKMTEEEDDKQTDIIVQLEMAAKRRRGE